MNCLILSVMRVDSVPLENKQTLPSIEWERLLI